MLETSSVSKSVLFLTSKCETKHTCDPDSGLGPMVCYPFYYSLFKL